MQQKRMLAACAAVAMIAAGAGCGKQQEELTVQPTPAESPSPALSPSVTATGAPMAAADALAKSARGTRNVRFGDKLRLDGALVTRDGGGATINLYWESMEVQPLGYNVLVHVVNDRGDILKELDRPQAETARSVKAGETWQEPITISVEELKGGDAVAIGIYHPGGDVLKADRGKRDWNNVRLWIPLAGG